MSKHTPGPWEVIFEDEGEGHIIHMATAIENPGYFHSIHEVRYDHGVEPEEKGFEEAEANAHLIAAAPDLLEACKAILEDIEDTLVDCDSPGTRQTLEIQRDFLQDAIKKADGDMP
ncbi:MAG: hypothetical protein WC356_04865 [Candidatus Micrarchaeia archaeon]|jgi:hypothetical protein